MDNNLAVFNSEEFGSVRTAVIDNKILFCARDVAVALGYKRPAGAISMHCKGVSVLATPTPGGVQEMKYITEGDVYRLIIRSQLPSAEHFEAWLFDTVVPSIRQHGVYIIDPMLQKMMDNPGLLEKIIDTMVAERNRANSLTAKLAEVQPKAEYFDTFISPGDCTNIRNTAKELQVPERQFCRFLLESRLMYRSPAGTLMPYSKSQKDGLFIVKDFYSKSGFFGAYSLITPKGKDLIRTMLCKAAG